jgi:hypothetical protein
MSFSHCYSSAAVSRMFGLTVLIVLIAGAEECPAQSPSGPINVAGAVDRDQSVAQGVWERRRPRPVVIDKKHPSRAAKKLTAPVMPSFRLPVLTLPLHEGDVGRLPGEQFEVLQITGAKSARVRVVDGSVSDDILIKGLDVSHLVDHHAYLGVEGGFFVLPPVRYRTVTGGSNTVTAIEPFDTTKAQRIFAEIIIKEQAKLPPPKHIVPAAKSSPEARAKALLSNGRTLAKAGLYAAAEKKFRQAIAEAPETPMAAEAEKAVSELPAH